MKIEKKYKMYQYPENQKRPDIFGDSGPAFSYMKNNIHFYPTTLVEIDGDVGVIFGCSSYSVNKEAELPSLLSDIKFGVGRTGKFRFCNEYEVYEHSLTGVPSKDTDTAELKSHYRHDIDADFRTRIVTGVKL